MPLPAALRLELERPSEERLTLRVAKDRRGRVAPPVSIALGREAAKDAKDAKDAKERMWVRA